MQRRTDEDSVPSLFQWECVGMTGFWSNRQGFQSLYYMNLQIKKEELKEKIKEALKDLACGKLFRIKGFMQDENEKWIELNATQYEIQMNPVGEGQNVLIVIGEGLEEDALAKYFGTPAR